MEEEFTDEQLQWLIDYTGNEGRPDGTSWRDHAQRFARALIEARKNAGAARAFRQADQVQIEGLRARLGALVDAIALGCGDMRARWEAALIHSGRFTDQYVQAVSRLEPCTRPHEAALERPVRANRLSPAARAVAIAEAVALEVGGPVSPGGIDWHRLARALLDVDEDRALYGACKLWRDEDPEGFKRESLAAVRRAVIEQVCEVITRKAGATRRRIVAELRRAPELVYPVEDGRVAVVLATAEAAKRSRSKAKAKKRGRS